MHFYIFYIHLYNNNIDEDKNFHLFSSIFEFQLCIEASNSFTRAANNSIHSFYRLFRHPKKALVAAEFSLKHPLRVFKFIQLRMENVSRRRNVYDISGQVSFYALSMFLPLSELVNGLSEISKLESLGNLANGAELLHEADHIAELDD